MSLKILAAVLPALLAFAAAAQTNATNAPPPATNSAASAVPSDSPGVSGFVVDDKHKLGPGDKVSLQILEDRDPPKSLIVADSGEIDAPYVGRVMAGGKTCKELARELKTQLEKEYYYRASVVLGLDSVSKLRGRIYIWGQVRNQGPLDIPTEENFTARKAILRAGGFGDFANKKKVKVVRTAPDGSKENFELNMVEILEEGKTEKDITLQADDLIIVPARLVNL